MPISSHESGSPHEECLAHCALKEAIANLEGDVNTIFNMIVPRWVFMAACALVIICLGYITHVAAESRRNAQLTYERLLDKMDALQRDRDRDRERPVEQASRRYRYDHDRPARYP